MIGGGDVKLAALIGFALGPVGGPVALVIAPVFASAVALPMLATGRWTLKARFPYGPYMCAAAALVAVLAAL